jgi:streptomycin 6-kinase
VRRRRPGDGDARRAAELSEALRSVALEVATDWELVLGEPFALSRHSFVAPAGDWAVLKITPSEDDESEEEAEALELWAGDGAVRLLRRDRAKRALLLERVGPGTDISALPEAEATAAAVEVGRRLWRPAAGPFRWIGDHVPAWLAGEPSELTPLGLELYASLDVGSSTLVHGDFHHHNILASARGHLAIDPKPMLGEPEFDVPPFLWNPLPCRLRVEHLESRIAAFVAAGLDEERIRKWTVIRGAYLQPQEVDALVALV